MEDKIKKAYNDYQRQWRAKNKDKVKEINKRFWRKKAEEQEQEEQHQTSPEAI